MYNSSSALVAKKRKASSSSTQSTSDSDLQVSSHSKISRDLPQIPPPMIVDSESMVTLESVHTLGTFRHRPAFHIAVKNLKYIEKTDVPAFDFEHTWDKLRRVLHMIFHREETGLSLQQAYEACETVCQHYKAEDAYMRLKKELSLHVNGVTELLLRAQAEGQKFLAVLTQQWLELCSKLMTIRNIFIELDRLYIIRHTTFTSLIDFGQKLFKENVMGKKHLSSFTISEILLLIRRERNGGSVDREMICNLTTMLTELDLYTQMFEPAFLEDTQKYYNAEASAMLVTHRMTDYLTHTDLRLCQEGVERVQSYLNKSTAIPLINTIKTQFVHERVDQILQSGFDEMMDKSEKNVLRILYTCVNGSVRLIRLRNAFANYIKERGSELIRDTKKDSSMITSIISFKEKLDDITTHCFADNELFLNALKESFEIFVNSRRNRPAELLAKFMDNKLRSASRSEGQDIESVLDKLLAIFRYLQERDTFEAFYKRYLSRRLLLGRNISEDTEKRVLSKLKSECGAGFTKNLESMFRDIEVSADLQAQFKTSDEYPPRENIVFNINILAQGIWPSYSLCDAILPSYMVEYQRSFEKFYMSKLKGRRLTWQNFLSSCAVKGNYTAGTKEISVNLLQTAVLLLFNESDMLSYAEIATQTGIAEKDLKRTLKSLACSQHKLLLRIGATEEGAEISVLDSFRYNSAFTSSSNKIKINMLQHDQANDERKSTVTRVLVDRQHQLEAAIVRIMKNKKRLSHIMLIKELLTEVSFPVEVADLKKRIESLIEKEYLGRDDEDSDTYLYL